MSWCAVLRRALRIHLSSNSQLERDSDQRSAPVLDVTLKQELALVRAQLMAPIGKKRPTAKGKRKVNELACANEGSEPATRRLATGAGPASQKLQSQNATSEQSASDGLQIGSPKDASTYAAAATTPPTPYKWAAQAVIQAFGPVRARCLLRQPTGACLTCPGL
jgi:hypothetical protein